MDKLVGIYKIINKQNDNVYIGESIDIPIRWVQHLKDLTMNRHHSYKLQKDFNEYGIDNFEFECLESLYICEESEIETSAYKTKMTLLCREYINIIHYNSIENGYNIENTIDKILNNERGIFEDKHNNKDSILMKKFIENNKELLEYDIKLNQKFIELKSKKEKIKQVKQQSYETTEDTYIMSVIVKEFTELGIIDKDNIIQSTTMFKEKLQDNNLIYKLDKYFQATEFAIKNNYAIEGRKLYKDKEYKQILFTTKGKDFIYNLFNVSKNKVS